MKKQSFTIDTILLGIVLVLLIFLGFSGALAQDPTPTPEEKDAQKIEPEKLSGVPKIAPNYESEKRTLPDLGRVGVDMLSQKPLSLKEAITLALENNKDIEVSRQNVKIAEFDLQAADGFFEPRFAATSYYERSTTPNVSIFSNNRTTTNGSIVGNATYQGFIRQAGTNYSFSVNNQRVTTNNPISILSPQNNTSFNFSIVQPLARGRGFDNGRRLIEIAKRNLSLTDTQFRQRSIEIITNVQRAYWDLTYALRNLQVQRDGVKDAKDQLEHNKRLVEEGQLAPIDIVAAETQVANLETAVYDALEVVSRAENLLKNLIAQSKNDDLWNSSLVPTDSVELDAPNTTLPEALDLALQNRPEIEVNNVQKDINEIDRKFYKEQTKPQIDLTANYSSSGISGSFNDNFSSPFVPDVCRTDPDSEACRAAIEAFNQMVRQNAQAFTGGAQSTFTDILANRYPTFRVGVTINLPLGNQTAKANFGKSLVQSEQLQTQREQLEQAIQVDVRNALQAVRTAEARLRSAAISRENSAKQYDSERRKLDAGQSDIYKVLERQTALVNARSAELRAQTELNKSIADLQKATGNSLKANNVEARLRR